MTKRTGIAALILESDFLKECFSDLKATAFKSFTNANSVGELEKLHSDMQALIRLERYLIDKAQQEARKP